jgi:hypothetical protein
MKRRIIIKGKEYPCYMTMGAILRFRREAGYDIKDAKDIADQVVLLWCVVKSACAADGVSFDMGLEDFADNLNPESLKLLEDEAGTDEAKKKTE